MTHHFRTTALLAVSLSLVWLATPSSVRAESQAPTFLAHSGLAAPNASGDTNIALHKAVLSGAIRYIGSDRTDHPEKAFDGDESTSTGNAGNITVDLGATFVIDRVVVKFTSTPVKYQIMWSPYLGAADLPPTYDLASGLGHVPDSENSNQEFSDFAWIKDVQPTDDRKLPGQPARFLNFHFHQVYNGSWSNVSVNEIEVYGHPFVPMAGDHAFLSRKTWTATGYADAAPEGEGPTVGHGIDGQMTNAWLPHTETAAGQWYQLDLGAEVTFDRIDVLYAIGGGVGAAASMNVFASDDPTNWGDPIAKLDYGESAAGSFPSQHKRYLRIEQTATVGGWWQIDELNLLAPVVPGSVGPGPGAAGAGGAGGANSSSGTTGSGGAQGGTGNGGDISGATPAAGTSPDALHSGGTNSGSAGGPSSAGSTGTERSAGNAPSSTDSASCAIGHARTDWQSALAWALALGVVRLRRPKRAAAKRPL